MAEEKTLSEKESLDLITSMINKAKNSYHDKGIGPIVWGCIITICSLVSFFQLQYHFELPVDIWWLTLIALVPQIYFSIRDKKKRTTKSYNDDAMDYVWVCFGIAIFLLVNINNNLVSVLNTVFTDYRRLGGTALDFNYFNYSSAMMLLLYGLPTIITGGIMKFKPMLFGGILCWICCAVSVYTDLKVDMLLTALSAIFAWLVPGIILWNRYKKRIACNV
jgi:hypothetical protein